MIRVAVQAESAEKRAQLCRKLSTAEDICLQDGDGFDVLVLAPEDQGGPDKIRDLLEQRPELKILCAGPAGDRNLMLDVLDAGASDFLPWDSSPEETADHVRRLQAGETDLDPAVQETVLREFRRLRVAERSFSWYVQAVPDLTPAEHDLVKLLLEGRSAREISVIRCTETVTVKTQIRSLLRKFGCTRTEDIVEMLREHGIDSLFRG